ncbi:hypothetical protein QIH85_43045 [Bradyrhizobium japonicum]|uniref:hypothetical protein n=1 Tax=Bradyrhizobium japonicum TaxID=375 RepID=UPI001E60E814|nr:hypothetical protein [Bradyrhizobium japonicum]MCD9898141.1 hypothetical protein [Bradyrhizobium japonicum]WLB28510.1 hypothetical protein QIH85_43045 [Bradyrhizobium japonicum]WRJ84736.1 hypothetical protein R3F78_07610 [Bradyrhizobium japonicum]WRJ93706.1 hypothetical protein R3F77_05320 [Bradyrhizobium japonicum]WRK47558.1 hypothetical protein R3F73_05380 [Bradyrhizobium japonicum]
MAKLADVLAAVDALGFDPARVKHVARRLSEAGKIPSGGPSRAPDLSEDDVLRLLMAVTTSPKLRQAETSVETYGALTPEGAHIADDAPDSIPRNAADAIAVEVEMARRGHVEARRSTIEFVRSWPEIVIESRDGSARFRQLGANAALWATGGHRTATTIPVAAVADILDALFG